MQLDQKVAMITGASSGIGAGISKALAAKGVKVGLAARRVDKLQNILDTIEDNGGEGTMIEMDVTDKHSVKSGAKQIIDVYGRIDILVNNAGIMPASDIASLKTDEWDRMIDVNIKGVFNVIAAVLPHFIEQNSGHIINLSSIAGRKLFKGLGVYCATKHAVAAFSDIMRMEIAPEHNIRVTCLQPGAVATELFEQITDMEYKAQMEGLQEQFTFLSPKDIAHSAIYALEAPEHVDVSELFILPSGQAW